MNEEKEKTKTPISDALLSFIETHQMEVASLTEERDRLRKEVQRLRDHFQWKPAPLKKPDHGSAEDALVIWTNNKDAAKPFSLQRLSEISSHATHFIPTEALPPLPSPQGTKETFETWFSEHMKINPPHIGEQVDVTRIRAAWQAALKSMTNS